MSAHRPARLRLAALALLLPLAPLPALALSATAASNVNIRSGPGKDFAVVTQLHAGDIVDVSKCQGTFCLVTHGSSTGWVSATFLTRDNIGKPAPTVTAAAPATVAKPGLPRPITTKPTAPQVAATAKPAIAPRIAETPANNVPILPPAHDVTALPAPAVIGASPDVADIGVPRPQADVPNGALTGPDDEDQGFSIPAPGASDGLAADIPPQQFSRLGETRPFRLRRNWADLTAGGGGEACFYADGEAPDAGFCVQAGDTLADLGRWTDEPLNLSNPAGLPVTVCTNAGIRDCHLLRASAPLTFADGVGVASIRVGEPGY